MLTVTLATQNAHKVEEMTAMLKAMGVQDKIRLLLPESDEEIDETGSTFIENAVLKASQTKPSGVSSLVIADDTYTSWI